MIDMSPIRNASRYLSIHGCCLLLKWTMRYKLPDGMLTGVVFGTNITDEVVEWIQEQIKSTDLSVSYSKIVPNRDHYLLNRVDLT